MDGVQMERTESNVTMAVQPNQDENGSDAPPLLKVTKTPVIRRSGFLARWWWLLAIVALVVAVPALGRKLLQRQIVVDQLQRTKEQCDRAEQNVLLAMAAMGDHIDPLGIESRWLANEELAFYKTIYDQTAEAPAERFAIAVARERAGLVNLKLHAPNAARLCFTLAIHILESLPTQNVDWERAAGYAITLAETHVAYASYYETVGDVTTAEVEFKSAAALPAKLLNQRPDSQWVAASEARVWQARGAMYARLHRYAEAEDDLHRALPVRIKRLFYQGEYPQWRNSPAFELTETRLELANVCRQTNRASEAVALIDEAAKDFQRLMVYRDDLHFRSQHAQALEMLGRALADDGQAERSTGAYRKALDAYQSLERDCPESARFHQKTAEIGKQFGEVKSAYRGGPSNSSSPASGTATQSGRLFSS
jgi:tetratricopeptide (TPR) repeat protein